MDSLVFLTPTVNLGIAVAFGPSRDVGSVARTRIVHQVKTAKIECAFLQDLTEVHAFLTPTAHLVTAVEFGHSKNVVNVVQTHTARIPKNLCVYVESAVLAYNLEHMDVAQMLIVADH